MNEERKRLRGLVMLVRDAVEHGSRAVEKVHLETARRPFAILEHVPGIETPTKIVHAVHDLTVASVYETIRVVNRVVGSTVDLVIEHAPERDDVKPR
jgi:hypothetical protein